MINTGSNQTEQFPIVALGASAGGLEAFQHFFKAIPIDCNLAYILISHLAADHVSLLPEIIQKITKIRVQQASDGMVIEPNNVYVIPPGKNISVHDGVLKLEALKKHKGLNLVIDMFFTSLAKDQGSNAVAIILSGTGSDGSKGIKAIKDAGGMVMVQDADTAMHDGMPRSAIATRLVDYVLPVEEMPKQIIKYIQHALNLSNLPTSNLEVVSPASLQKILNLIKSNTGHDFSFYKENTIRRRIERRMTLQQLSDVEEYVNYLQGSELEVNVLFKELLIGVTCFFRNPTAFEALSNKYLPQLLSDKSENYTIRVWVAACSTGEEAYSIAIMLHECLKKIKRNCNVQIFATDLDEQAIEIARLGVYPEAILADVTVDRINRYFSIDDDGQYRVKKFIREMIVFAPQNIIKDPPFTKLDLLSCRNLLIYFNSELQKKIFPIFNYSLKNDGILFLGSSESIVQDQTLFSVLDKKWKLYTPNQPNKHIVPLIEWPLTPASLESIKSDKTMVDMQTSDRNAIELVESILHRSNTPPCAIIDQSKSVLYIHGKTGRYLEPAEGKVTNNIIEMARTGIKSSLISGITKVAQHKQEVIFSNLRINNNSHSVILDLIITPMLEYTGMKDLMMITFEEKKSTDSQSLITSPKKKNRKVNEATIHELEQELLDSKHALQTTIEELETSNEDLKSTNEELQSTNEELQSTNEELETSKEELQSLNEESATVNADLQSRVEELSQTSDDLKNLLDSTNIATLFLDAELCIRRFTPKATDIIPLSITDCGRPIEHFATTLIDADLTEQCTKVLQDLAVREVEKSAKNGDTYLIIIRPYRTLMNVIDGVVITFENISDRKKDESALLSSEALYRALFEHLIVSFILLDPTTKKIIATSTTTAEKLGYTYKALLTKAITDITTVNSHTKLAQNLNKTLQNTTAKYRINFKSENGSTDNIMVKTQCLDITTKTLILLKWRQ